MYMPGKLKGWEFLIMFLCIILTWIGIYFFVPHKPPSIKGDITLDGVYIVGAGIFWIVVFSINFCIKEHRNDLKTIKLREQIKDHDVKIYMEKQIDDLVKNSFIYIPKYIESYVHGGGEDNVRISQREMCLEREFKKFGVNLSNPLHVQEALINWKDARSKKDIVNIDY